MEIGAYTDTAKGINAIFKELREIATLQYQLPSEQATKEEFQDEINKIADTYTHKILVRLEHLYKDAQTNKMIADREIIQHTEYITKYGARIGSSNVQSNEENHKKVIEIINHRKDPNDKQRSEAVTGFNKIVSENIGSEYPVSSYLTIDSIGSDAAYILYGYIVAKIKKEGQEKAFNECYWLFERKIKEAALLPELRELQDRQRGNDLCNSAMPLIKSSIENALNELDVNHTILPTLAELDKYISLWNRKLGEWITELKQGIIFPVCQHNFIAETYKEGEREKNNSTNRLNASLSEITIKIAKLNEDKKKARGKKNKADIDTEIAKLGEQIKSALLQNENEIGNIAKVINYRIEQGKINQTFTDIDINFLKHSFDSCVNKSEFNLFELAIIIGYGLSKIYEKLHEKFKELTGVNAPPHIRELPLKEVENIITSNHSPAQPTTLPYINKKLSKKDELKRSKLSDPIIWKGTQDEFNKMIEFLKKPIQGNENDHSFIYEQDGVLKWNRLLKADKKYLAALLWYCADRGKINKDFTIPELVGICKNTFVFDTLSPHSLYRIDYTITQLSESDKEYIKLFAGLL